MSAKLQNLSNGIWVIYFHGSQRQIRWKIAICSNLCINFSLEGPNSFSDIFSTIPFTLLLLLNNPCPWQLMSNCQKFFIIVPIYYYYYRRKLSMNSWCQKIEGLRITKGNQKLSSVTLTLSQGLKMDSLT